MSDIDLSASDFSARNDGHLATADFASLAEVFAGHLAHARGGMAFSVYRRGQPLVRLHGGSTVRRDRPDDVVEPSAAWGPDTMAVLFSGTKGLVATIAAMLVDRGQLDVNEPVARYWPEFAAGGKADVRVHHLLSHTVGLPYVDPEPQGEWAQLDNAANAAALAAQTPLWTPGGKVAYHAITYGYLMNEVFVRITGKSAGTLIAELLAKPLDADIYLGLPPEHDPRLAPVFRADDYAISTFLTDPERRRIVERMYGNSLIADELPSNSVQMHRAELAAGGGIATADAMASLYSQLADPRHPLVSGPVLADATRTWSEGIDAINDRPLRFGLGYELVDPIGTYGPVDNAFGHSGAGGGLHGAWPDADIGFSFLTNEMMAENQDFRVKDLLAQLHRIL